MPKVADTDTVKALLDDGAQAVEVLPPSAYRTEHLPGAVSIPLPDLRHDALGDLDKAKPIVVYCYDHECDLSARGAARLEQFGFTDVYDYAESKTAWVGAGLPAEGDVLDDDRAGGRARPVPTCGADATVGDVVEQLEADGTYVVVVTTDGTGDGIVLGALHPQAAGLPASTNVLDAADPGPATVRPSITRHELARSMEDETHPQEHVLVSTYDGRLIGIVTRDDLR